MYRAYGKRLMDIFLTLVLCPLACLVAIPVALAIYLEDRGPILYRAPRVGKEGKVFIMYKFRSMRINAPDLRNEDGSAYTAQDDPRVTKVGRLLRKTSVDEFPQLFNVISGEMSLIGPRPNLVTVPWKQMETMEQKRLLVLPGITGLCQATVRNAASTSEKYSQDVYYVDHMSLKLDCIILAKTVISVLQHKNIYGKQSKRNEIKQ